MRPERISDLDHEHWQNGWILVTQPKKRKGIVMRGLQFMDHSSKFLKHTLLNSVNGILARQLTFMPLGLTWLPTQSPTQ